MDWIEKFIDKLGNYVGLDLRYYIKNSFYLIFAQGVSMVFGFLMSITFARLLTKEIYGQWNYIFSIIGVLAIFTLPGMDTAITQAVARGHDKVLIEGTKERFKWSILGSIAVFVVGVYYFMIDSVLLGKCIMISSLFLPFFQNFQTYSAFLSGKKQFDKVAMYQAVTLIISVLVTVLVIYFSRNLILILIANLFSISVFHVYFFSTIIKNIKNGGDNKEAITFGKHLTISQIPNQFRNHYDKIVIGIFLGFSDLAVYSIALGVYNLINPLRSVIATLIFPKLSQMEEQHAYSEVKERLPYLIIGAAVIAGLLILFCPYIIPLFYSKRYTASVIYAQILLISFIFSAPVPAFTKALLPSQKKIKEIYKIRIANALIEIVLLTFLIISFGLLGAVIAKFLTRLFTMLYSWKIIK